MTGKSAKKNEMADKLTETEAKASEYLEMAQRLQADFDNFRKRTQREIEDIRKFAAFDIIQELLNLSDDLGRALQHADPKDILTQGIIGIRTNLEKMLQARGVTEIENETFDPSLHEAFCVEPGEENGRITEVFQKGYRLNGRVLRCSKVKVTKKTEEGEEKCQGSSE